MTNDPNPFNRELHELEDADTRDLPMPPGYEDHDAVLPDWPADISTKPYKLNESQAMMPTMIDLIQQYLNAGNVIKTDWVKYIKDRSIPLDDRWDAFLAAPAEWRTNTSKSTIPINSLVSVFASPYDDLDMERREAITVDTLFEKLWECTIDPNCPIEDQTPDEPTITVKQFDTAREDALVILLGEWTYDW